MSWFNWPATMAVLALKIACFLFEVSLPALSWDGLPSFPLVLSLSTVRRRVPGMGWLGALEVPGPDLPFSDRVAILRTVETVDRRVRIKLDFQKRTENSG